MKKILLLAISILAYVFSFAQNTLPFPIQQSIGSDSTLLSIHNAQANGLIFKCYSDTTVANATHFGYYNGAIIFTNNWQTEWYRFSNKWYVLSGSGSTIPNLQQVLNVGNTTRDTISFTTLSGTNVVNINPSGGIGTNIEVIDTNINKKTRILANVIQFYNPATGNDLQIQPDTTSSHSSFTQKFQQKTGTVADVSDISDSIHANTPSLQNVMDVNNETTDDYLLVNSSAQPLAAITSNSTQGNMAVIEEPSNKALTMSPTYLGFSQGSPELRLVPQSLTGSNTQILQDKNGTIADLRDIPYGASLWKDSSGYTTTVQDSGAVINNNGNNDAFDIFSLKGGHNNNVTQVGYDGDHSNYVYDNNGHIIMQESLYGTGNGNSWRVYTTNHSVDDNIVRLIATGSNNAGDTATVTVYNSLFNIHDIPLPPSNGATKLLGIDSSNGNVISLPYTNGSVTSLHDSTTNGVAITWINRTTTPAPVAVLNNIIPTSVQTNSVNLLRQYGYTPPPAHGNALIDSVGLGIRDSTGRTVFINKSHIPAGVIRSVFMQNKDYTLADSADVSAGSIAYVNNLDSLMTYTGSAQSVIVQDSMQGGGQLFHIVTKGINVVDSALIYPSAIAGKVALRIYDGSKPYNIRWWYCIKADDTHDDGDSIINIVNRGYTNLYFPNGVYYSSVFITKSNVSFTLDKDCVFDGGVFHVIGSSVLDGKPEIPIYNIHFYGELKVTERFGCYSVDSITFVGGGIRVMKNSTAYRQQTADGGSRGVHIYNNTKNFYCPYVITQSTKDSTQFALGINATVPDTTQEPDNIEIGYVYADSASGNSYYSQNAGRIHIGSFYGNAWGQSAYAALGLNGFQVINSKGAQTYDNVILSGDRCNNSSSGGGYFGADSNLTVGTFIATKIPFKGLVTLDVLANVRNFNLKFGSITTIGCGNYGCDMLGDFSADEIFSQYNNTTLTASISNLIIKNSNFFSINHYRSGRDTATQNVIVQTSKKGYIGDIHIGSSLSVALQFLNDTNIVIDNFYAKATQKAIQLTSCLNIKVNDYSADSLSGTNISNVSVKGFNIKYPAGTTWFTNPHLDSGFNQVGNWFTDTIPSSSSTYTSTQFYAGDFIRVQTPVAKGILSYVCMSSGAPGTWKPSSIAFDSTNNFILNVNGAGVAAQTNSGIWLDGTAVTKSLVIANGANKTANNPFNLYDETGATLNRIEMVANDGTNDAIIESLNRVGSSTFPSMTIKGGKLTMKAGIVTNVEKLYIDSIGVGLNSQHTTGAQLNFATQTATANSEPIKYCTNSSSNPALNTTTAAFTEQLNTLDRFYSPKSAALYKYCLLDTPTNANVNGEIPIYSTTTGHFIQATITQGANITVTNAAGAITIASTTPTVLKGNSTTTGTGTTAVTVTIGSTMANTTYTTSIIPRDLLTAVNWYISAQTTTTFTVTFVTALTGSIIFDYTINP